MEDKNVNWVIASEGNAQFYYVGNTTLREEEIISAIERRIAITLSDCRVLRSIVLPFSPGKFSVDTVVNGIGGFNKGIRMFILPIAFTVVEEKDLPLLMLLIKACEENEVKHRLKAAGLAGPDGRDLS